MSTVTCHNKEFNENLPFDERLIIANFSNTTLISRDAISFLLKHSDSLGNAEVSVYTLDSVDKKKYYCIESYKIDNNSNQKIELKYKNINRDVQFYRLYDILIKNNIVGVSCDRKKMGISIELYRSDCKFIYVENINNVSNEEWLNYFKTINKVNNNWYVDCSRASN
jgi:hypothetical protein